MFVCSEASDDWNSISMSKPACGRLQSIPGSGGDLFKEKGDIPTVWGQDVTSVGTGVVEDVHTTEAGMETFRADAKDMEGVGNSDAGTERRPKVPDGVASTPGGDMGQSMDQSGKGVPKFLRDQLRVRKEVVKRTRTPQQIIGGVPGSNEESAPSPWQSEGLWMEIATALDD
jgi:hypothetical protein